MANIGIRKGHMFRSPKINVSTVFYDRLKRCFLFFFFFRFAFLFFRTNAARPVRHQFHQDSETCGTAASRKDSHYKALWFQAVKVSTKYNGTSSWLQLHEEIQHEEGLMHLEAYLFSFYLLIIMALGCIAIVFFFFHFFFMLDDKSSY